MYSTGNYIHDLMINHNGKGYKKRMSTCVQLSYVVVQQRLAQRCKSALQLKTKPNRSSFGD